MSNFKEIIKHGGNYLIANLATRALAFISIPVYTRMLSTEDYGITAVFLATVGILNSLLSLGFDASVSRYYFDKKSNDDFKDFVSTAATASLTILLITSFVLYINTRHIATLLNLPVFAVYLLVPMVIINIIGSFFVQIYQPQKLSKPIAISSLVRVYIGFSFSIGLIYFFSSERYLGQIVGQIFAGMLMLFYWIRKIFPYLKKTFRKEHLKYILCYSIPLIPYALSGVIIEQFGKLTIASNNGLSQAGFYTLAISIASLTGIVTEITHQAWYPFYMEYMKTKNYVQHDSDLTRIFKISLLAAMFFSCFGLEIGSILAKKEFTSALYVIPILCIGYIFHQLSYAYMRNISFVIKTSYMSAIVITSGLVNILLNSIFIIQFGIIGSALSFVLSYLVMAILAWAISIHVIRVRSIPILKLLKPFALLLCFLIPLFWVFDISNPLLQLVVKSTLFTGFFLVIARNEKKYIVSFLMKYKKR